LIGVDIAAIIKANIDNKTERKAPCAKPTRLRLPNSSKEITTDVIQKSSVTTAEILTTAGILLKSEAAIINQLSSTVNRHSSCGAFVVPKRQEWL
jgi:hypothetical protein